MKTYPSQMFCTNIRSDDYVKVIKRVLQIFSDPVSLLGPSLDLTLRETVS